MKISIIGLLALLFLITACKKDEPTPETITFGGTIQIVPNAKQVVVGDTFTIYATYYDKNNVIQNVNFNWEISDSSLLKISANQLITAKKPGIATIKAKFENKESELSTITIVGMADNNTQTGNNTGNNRTGSLSGKNGYSGQGTAGVELTNGQLKVFFGTNFSVQNGPDLVVYLSNAEVVQTTSLLIGDLSQTSGSHSYEAPLGTNLSDYNYVVIHCRAVNRAFAVALLQ